MKLFCVVLVVYVVALTLFGVDGRGGGGGGSTKGLEVSDIILAALLQIFKISFCYRSPCASLSG